MGDQVVAQDDMELKEEVKEEVNENGDGAEEAGGPPRRPERKLTLHKVFLEDSFNTYIVDSTQAFDNIVKMFRKDIQEFRILSVDSETTMAQFLSGGPKTIDLLSIGTLNGRVYLFRSSVC